MRYTAPVAELLAIETVSVVLASTEVTTEACSQNTVVEGGCPEEW